MTSPTVPPDDPSARKPSRPKHATCGRASVTFFHGSPPLSVEYNEDGQMRPHPIGSVTLSHPMPLDSSWRDAAGFKFHPPLSIPSSLMLDTGVHREPELLLRKVCKLLAPVSDSAFRTDRDRAAVGYTERNHGIGKIQDVCPVLASVDGCEDAARAALRA